MAISRPRTARHAFSFNCAKSLSLASPRPSSAAPATRAPGAAAHQGQREHGLAAARFTDESQRLRRVEPERDVVHRPDHPAAVGKSTVRLRTSSKLM